MINGLKPHPAMKKIGMEWNEALPAHWAVHRIRSLVLNVVERQSSPQQGDMHIALEHVESWTGRIKGGSEEAEPDSQWNCFCRGDVLFGKLRPYLAKVTRVAMSGRCVGEFLVLRPKCTDLDSRFLERLLRSKPVIDVVDSSTFGAKMPRAEWAFIGALKIGCPPLTEQSAIVRFLDHADDRIQRYIYAKEKLITLLEDQKQAVIHQAVTGQINVRTGECYPACKDSGVEWLGEVPEHWDVRGLGQIGTFSKGSGGNKDDEVPEGVPCIRYGDLYTTHKYFIRSSRSCVPRARAADYTLLRFGDLLFAGSGETMEEIGKSAVNLVRSEVRCGGDIIVFRANREVEPEFLGYATDAPSAVAQKATMGRGFTVMHIYAKQLKRLALALPPLAEQVEIARFLNDALARIDAGIVAAARQIRLVQELRSSLTADVVTGKLDVREAASTLPERHLTQDAASVHADP
ncbi:MAG: restriction endonuclease subunit S [Rhodospirillales bacterium]|nr:restriction endonuclease subunit S [Rhodospirillales bacterium]